MYDIPVSNYDCAFVGLKFVRQFVRLPLLGLERTNTGSVPA